MNIKSITKYYSFDFFFINILIFQKHSTMTSEFSFGNKNPEIGLCIFENQKCF